MNNLSLHNYFPPKKDPFVFNLASFDEDIVKNSMNHIKNAIKISSSIGSRFFSFHAGYLIDPKVDELGNRIKKRIVNNRQESKEKFIKRVNEASQYAKNLGVKILIENNVLSYRNYKEFGDNPLLMVGIEEAEEIMDLTDSNVGLLIDVAHLKVSSKTLGFSAEEYLKILGDKIDGYHLSDNNGIEDTNELIMEDSWFWPHIENDAEYYSIEVYNVDENTLFEQLKLVQNKLKNII